MDETQGQNLPVLLREATNLVRNPAIDPSQAAAALKNLPIPQRALALAGAFSEHLDTVAGAEATDATQRLGRRSERILDELPDDDAAHTLEALIEAGDVELVLSMVRGHAGEASSAAMRLTPELIAEVYENDPDLHRHDDEVLGRLLAITWTLVMETPDDCAGVNRFFASHEAATHIRNELQHLANFNDENALQVLRKIEERREWFAHTDSDEAT